MNRHGLSPSINRLAVEKPGPSQAAAMDIGKARRSAVAIAAVGLSSAVAMYWCLSFGPGVTPDSTIYLDTARSLLAGKGFYANGEPLTQYPPLYPLLLALVGLAEPDLLETGRLLHAALFGANAALFGLIVSLCTRHALSAVACALLLFTCSKSVFLAHSMAWSEAPFITFLLGVFLLSALYAANGSRRLLLMMAAAGGAAIATRYAGLALLPPMIAGILTIDDRPLRRRAKDALIAASVACLPLVAWLIRNSLTAPSLTNRSLVVHLAGGHQIAAMADTLHEMIVPVKASPPMTALHLALLFALLVTALVRLAKGGEGTLPAVVLLFVPAYLAFIVVSQSLFDAATKIGPRIMLPPFLALGAAGTVVAWSVARSVQRPFIWRSFLAYGMWMAYLGAGDTLSAAAHLRDNGQGYASRRWYESAILGEVMLLPKTVKIYSNGPDLVKFITARDAVMIPPRVFQMEARANPDYERQLAAMCAECREEGKAVVVYLNGIDRPYLPTRDELESGCDARILKGADDGTLYGGPP